MGRKMKKGEKAANAGISLDPKLKQQATDMAKERGFRNLTALVRFLLHSEISKEKSADL